MTAKGTFVLGAATHDGQDAATDLMAEVSPLHNEPTAASAVVLRS